MGNVLMAVDCDLHRIHCWCSECGLICSDYPSSMVIEVHHRQHMWKNEAMTFLFEIASPVSAKRGGESSAIMYNLTKWVIFNSITVALFSAYLKTHTPRSTLLVSPSNLWTHGYDVKARHALAKATAKNKDLRECESMIFMYRKAPEKWVNFEKYLEEL